MMQGSYAAPNVVYPLDTRDSRRYNWLQMFSMHFPSEKLVICFLLIQYIQCIYSIILFIFVIYLVPLMGLDQRNV